MLTKVGVVKGLSLFEIVIFVHTFMSFQFLPCAILTNAADAVFNIVELSILLACLSELCMHNDLA